MTDKSKNGTWLNGRKLGSERVVVRHGDEICLEGRRAGDKGEFDSEFGWVVNLSIVE